MRKTLLLVTSLILSLSLYGCSSTSTAPTTSQGDDVTNSSVEPVVDEQQSKWSKIIELDRQGLYYDAVLALNDIYDKDKYDSPEYNYFQAKAESLKDEPDEDKIIKYISAINPTYSGALKDQIHTFVHEYISDYTWEYINSKYIKEKQEKEDLFKAPEPPKIGMTRGEAQKSTWGKPIDINKTTTKYGTHEQWVYDGYKYLYFEDGILTSIQD